MSDSVPIGEAGESGAARVAAFGRWLRQERELRGVSRAAVVTLTKLPPLVVEALESGDAARMPPAAYVVGYLRTYAAAAGLDANEVVLRWQEIAPAVPAKASRGGGASNARAALVVAAAALALALAAAAFALFAGR